MGNEKLKLAHQGQPSPQRRGRSAMSRWAKPQHKAAARMMGYCLTLGTSGGWVGFSQWAKVRLAPEERAALAFMALRSLDHETACMTADAALGFEQSEAA
ncbi:hypothetical protein MAA5396_04767 [Marinovum algicola]|uniref:Uncharacterized protein n=1 Tax=Marinovum algicola TaxID=42444 RepID=A0A975WEN2_9RHOB|nr:hypothetical protein [Marinovum algicola]SEK08211.1 hypothetical protein SAMN04487940_12620 [Marinovum algicola]SLN76595.1 hypothetical protein MAA5396_04767 [Marinovum algicola]